MDIDAHCHLKLTRSKHIGAKGLIETPASFTSILQSTRSQNAAARALAAAQASRPRSHLTLIANTACQAIASH